MNFYDSLFVKFKEKGVWKKVAFIDDLTEHTSRTDNPHQVTASQVGAIAKVEDDAEPKLGGDLDSNSHNIDLNETTHENQTGVISKGGIRFIHDFNYGNNGTVTTRGYNLFIGLGAGNFEMGSDASLDCQASFNLGIGVHALQSNTTGYRNVAIGAFSLERNTEGRLNVAIGAYSLSANETGHHNFAIGVYALRSNVSGSSNMAIGSDSLGMNTTGSQNIAIGSAAGKYTADASAWKNTSPENSIYIGFNTKAFSDGDINEVIIGHGQIGYGSNTIRIGNFGMGQIGTTLTPRNNHDLVIELTANNTITFKLRGTDGAVRTATIMLS